MPNAFAGFCRCFVGVALLALLLAPQPTRSEELADFHTAIARALDQYHFTMSVLEMGSQEQTAAEVGRLRQAWQGIAERFSRRPDGFSIGEDYGATFMQVDMRLITLLLIIELGNRDAARQALAAVGDILTQWSDISDTPR